MSVVFFYDICVVVNNQSAEFCFRCVGVSVIRGVYPFFEEVAKNTMNEIKSLEHPTLKVCKNVHILTHYKLYTKTASPYFVNL